MDLFEKNELNLKWNEMRNKLFMEDESSNQ